MESFEILISENFCNEVKSFHDLENSQKEQINSDKIQKKLVRAYLRYIYKELKKRSSRRELSFKIFYNYLHMPKCLSSNIFRCFDLNGKGFLSELEFVNGLFNLFLSDYSSRNYADLIFKILDSREKEEITYEEVLFLISSTFSERLSSNFTNLKPKLKEFFQSSYSITKDEFGKNKENFILKIFNKFFIENTPFNQQGLDYFSCVMSKEDLECKIYFNCI
jgi:hypothetical protein